MNVKFYWQAEDRQEAVVMALEARLGCITGAPNEVLDDAARHYRQTIYKLSHKISQIKSEVCFDLRRIL